MSMNSDNYYRDADQCECEDDSGWDHQDCDQEEVPKEYQPFDVAAWQERIRQQQAAWSEPGYEQTDDFKDPFAD